MTHPPLAIAPVKAFTWSREIIDTVRLAWPMALTQLGQVAMLTTDLVLIGRLGEASLAAASLGHTALFALFVIGMGLATAVAPLASQAFGARDPRGLRRALRAGLQAAALLGLPLSVLLLWAEPVLVRLGQDPTAAALAGRYLVGMGWCLAPGWMFIALRGFMGAVNRPEPALWITLAAIPLNAVLAFALINGEGGLPQFGIVGAGIATTIVNVCMCAAGIAVVTRQRPYRKYHPLGRFWRWDGARMGRLLVVGLPISGAFLMEFGLFGAAALLMGTFGTSALAAHQIALQTAAALFMIPLGMSMAATVRVGHAVGRQDFDAARRAGWTAIMLAAGIMGLMAVGVVVLRHSIPAAFLGTSADAVAAGRLASQLLLLGASFAVFDGVQSVAAGALRGYSDTSMPLFFALISYWAIGFVACWLLAYRQGLGPHGVWIGLSIGLAAFAILLVGRFWWLAHRERQSQDPELVSTGGAA
jgi:multidrug resistance protein, MATE family